MRQKTIKVFEEICRTTGANYIIGVKNPVKINGDTTTIYCLQKDKVFECIIDTYNLNKVKLNRVWVVNNSKLSKRPRVVCDSSHIFIYKCLLDVPDGYVIDHINRDTLDNRMSNLRAVTPGVNMLNKEKYNNSKTGITGIIELNGNYRINIARQFNDLDIAIKANNEVQRIIDYYSNLDATKRVV